MKPLQLAWVTATAALLGLFLPASAWADESPPGPPAPGADPRAVIAAAATRLPNEPPLEALEDAALRYLDAHPEAVARWLSAPRRAALLPDVKLTADLDQERDESLDKYQDDPDRWGADTDKDLGFQLSLTWRLAHLVYSPEQARVHSVIVDRAERREAVLSTLIRAYFERRKLLLRLAIAPPADPLAYLDLTARRDELTALIDALTGGALRRHTLGPNGAMKRP